MALQEAGMDDDNIAEHLIRSLGMSWQEATKRVSQVRMRFASF
jgi:hypothetical protein